MKLRTRLNLVVAGLTATFVAVLHRGRDPEHADVGARGDRGREPRGRAAARPSRRDLFARRRARSCVLQFLQQLGRVRANDIILRPRRGEVLYRSPARHLQGGSHGAGVVRAAARAERRATHVSLARRHRSSIVAGRSPRAPSSTRGTTSCGCWRSRPCMLVVVNGARVLARRPRARALSGDRRRARAHCSAAT